MRDPNRMDAFLEELKKEWQKVPDWRFIQLMYNFIDATSASFYLEEDEFIEKLRKYMKTNVN